MYHAWRMPYRESVQLQFHRLRHELSNYAVFRLARFDGVIVSMHQAGTHWLKYMLASAMADAYGIPQPRYNHANDIIGGVKDARPHPHVPHLVSTHSIAPLAVKLPFIFKHAHLPPTVLLVRDLRTSLVSNYRKWHARYGVSFAEFLRGDPAGRRYNSDMWWCIRFQNAWGGLAARHASLIQIVRYEDIAHDAHAALARVGRHFALPLADANLDFGIAAATKPAMAARADPARPRGEVNDDDGDPLALYRSSDREFVRSRCARYLRYDFSYDYAAW
jgi:hypothetical protein